MKKLNETNIYNEIMKECISKNFSWDLEIGEDIIKLVFESIAIYLGQKKRKTEPQAFELRDVHGNFHFGAIVRFMPSEEDETKGSYSLTYTFSEADIAESGAKVSGMEDMLFRHVLHSVSTRNYAIEFRSDSNHDFTRSILIIAVDCIKKYMVNNIKIDPSIELDNFFTATAELEGETVYIAITPSAILKQHVKDDASIEEAAE